jgi:protein-L-isoaspartate(D-aspartate) O-methyltransferase
MKIADRFADVRERMVQEQLLARGIQDTRVLEAFRAVPRHLFVPEREQKRAYADMPLALAPGATISQPYIVALMLEKLGLSGSERVLEIGTGSGYETALLASLAKEVWSIEIDADLSYRAQETVHKLGHSNVQFLVGDGYLGWPEHGPYERIVVSAAPLEIPRELVRELASGGRMILPFGEEPQELIALEKTAEGLVHEELGAVRFVPLRK